MRYADDVLMMRSYLKKVDEIEALMESLRFSDEQREELDGFITEYFKMWSSCYNRLLNAPKWMWTDC